MRTILTLLPFVTIPTASAQIVTRGGSHTIRYIKT